MSTILRPVGPQPGRVYWVRRLLLLAVLVVVALVVWALTSLGDDGAAADAGASAEPDDGEAAADDAEGSDDGRPGACGPADLTVALTADSRSYPDGAEPTFTLAVTNTSDVPCTIDAGSGNQVVTITSGSDRIWSSADCEADQDERLLLLDPGSSTESAVPWSRVRSDEECSDGLPDPRPGTYTAVGSMLGAESGTAVFELG